MYMKQRLYTCQKVCITYVSTHVRWWQTYKQDVQIIVLNHMYSCICILNPYIHQACIRLSDILSLVVKKCKTKQIKHRTMYARLGNMYDVVVNLNWHFSTCLLGLCVDRTYPLSFCFLPHILLFLLIHIRTGSLTVGVEIRLGPIYCRPRLRGKIVP